MSWADRAEFVKDLALKDLFEVEVSSAAKRSQGLIEVPYSMTIITADEIRRSGATRLQDLLRFVPGYFLVDEDETVNTSSLREDADAFAQSILFLVDGVPLNSNTIGSFRYGMHEVPMENIARIEVIRGSGGVFYGAGSATGVVNIITTAPGEEEGCRVGLGGGNNRAGRAYLGCGGEAGKSIAWNSYLEARTFGGFPVNPDFAEAQMERQVVSGEASATLVNDTVLENPFRNSREKESLHLNAGFTMSWGISPKFDLQNSLYGGVMGVRDYRRDIVADGSNRFAPDTMLSRSFLFSSRGNFHFSKGHEAFVLLSHRFARQKLPTFSDANLGETLSNFEMQDNLNFGERFFLSTGLNLQRVDYRQETRTGDILHLRDPQADEMIIAGMVGTTTRFGKNIDLHLGAKAETWTLIGPEPEILPSARLLYRISPEASFFTSWTRSITTPGYIQSNVEFRQALIPVPEVLNLIQPNASDDPGIWIAVLNDPAGLKPAEYRSTEVGFRFLRSSHLRAELSLFRSDVKNRITVQESDVEKGVRDVLVARYDIPQAWWSTIYEDDVTQPDDIVVSPASGDTVVPLYYQNGASTVLYGLEAELAWSPTLATNFGFSYSGFDGSVDASNGNRESPAHIFRFSYGRTFPWKSRIFCRFELDSPYYLGAVYNYLENRLDLERGNTVENENWLSRLDISLEHAFFAERLRVQLWGQDLLRNNEVLHWGGFNNVYPHSVGRSYGLNLEMEI